MVRNIFPSPINCVATVGADLRSDLIALNKSVFLLSKHARRKVFFLCISFIFLHFLIWKWYTFLVFFIRWWSCVFNGLPAETQIAWQNMALSLNGWIPAFHEHNGAFFWSLFWLPPRDGKHTSAMLSTHSIVVMRKIITI